MTESHSDMGLMQRLRALDNAALGPWVPFGQRTRLRKLYVAATLLIAVIDYPIVPRAPIAGVVIAAVWAFVALPLVIVIDRRRRLDAARDWNDPGSSSNPLPNGWYLHHGHNDQPPGHEG